MDLEPMVDLFVAVGPTAAIAFFALWLNSKFMMEWTNRFDALEKTNRAVVRTLGEVTEALRRLNGKE